MKNNLGALLLWISNKLNKNQAELVTKIDHIQNLFKTAGEATATPADMLEGQTAYNGTALITGTMPDQGAKEETLIAGETYNIPRGYHDGEGTVTATDLASQTPGSASSVGILTGLEAWVAGEQITGTMPDKRATTVTAAAVTQDDEYTYLSLPEGEACYSGSSKVRALNSDLTYDFAVLEKLSVNIPTGTGTTYKETNYEIPDSAHKKVIIFATLHRYGTILMSEIKLNGRSLQNPLVDFTGDSHGHGNTVRHMVYQLNVSAGDIITIGLQGDATEFQVIILNEKTSI